MSDQIVVGTDGSASAFRAVEWAADDAARRRRPLSVVHAVESWPYRAPLFAPPEVAERLTAEGESIVEAARRAALDRHPDLRVTTRVVAEDPGRALREQAGESFEVVLGHRGRGGLAELLLGSTGLKVAGHVPGTVVIVRGEASAERADVVVGVDLLHDPHATLEYAFDTAAVRGARLRVVHAWETFLGLESSGYTVDREEVEGGLRHELSGVLLTWRKEHPDIPVEEEVWVQRPVSALTEASRGAALLVVGAHEFLGGLLRLGSVSHGVAHHAHCPVAVVRPR